MTVPSFWRLLFGEPVRRPCRRAETARRLEGQIRERDQVDQSGQRLLDRLEAEIKRYEAISEEALSNREGPE